MTIMGKQFSARNVARWTVDGTAITVETDADLPVGAWRENMQQDLRAFKRGDRLLPSIHMTDSFLGQSGTAVHGRGWKLHIPPTPITLAAQSKRLELWDAAEYASEADWSEWEGALASVEPPTAHAPVTGMSNDMTPSQRAALERLIQIAKHDTGQSRRVADFLLAWWNAGTCGKFDLTDLWGVDDVIAADMVSVFSLVANCHKYPDKLGYEKDFVEIVKAWRPDLE